MSAPRDTASAPAERRASFEPDAATGAKVIESLVLRGDLSGLGPNERARFYVQMCEGLGLNPHAQPFAFLRLNGKEVLYATRGATDQLAAIHKLDREIVDGPKVIDLAGTKLVYAVCRAKHPNGRVETSVATVPLIDPVNVLMKCETKAKRRATLSILGLGVLDEMELETIPANVQQPGGGVDLARVDDAQASPRDEEPAAPPRADAPVEPPPAEVPAAAEAFYARIGEIELPGEAVAVWMKHRPELASLSAAEREAAWKALCDRTEKVGHMKNSKVWLKKAIAEEDARRNAEPRPPADAPKPKGPAAAEGPVFEDDVIDGSESHDPLEAWQGLVANVESSDAAKTLWLLRPMSLRGPALERPAFEELAKALHATNVAAGRKVTLPRVRAALATKLGFEDLPPDGTDGQRRGDTPRAAEGRRSSSNTPADAPQAGAARATALGEFRAHLAEKPHVRDPGDRSGRDAEYSELATSYLKRAGAFGAEGLGDDALDLTRAELRARGCGDPDALLHAVAKNLSARRPAARSRPSAPSPAADTPANQAA